MITDSDDKVQQPTNDPFIDTPMKKPKRKAVYLPLSSIVLVSSKGKDKVINQGLLNTEALILTIKKDTKEEIIKKEDIQRAIRESLQENLQEKTSRESSLVSISIGSSSSANP